MNQCVNIKKIIRRINTGDKYVISSYVNKLINLRSWVGKFSPVRPFLADNSPNDQYRLIMIERQILELKLKTRSPYINIKLIEKWGDPTIPYQEPRYRIKHNRDFDPDW